jgi:DNA polymerase-3 subunit epsilon
MPVRIYSELVKIRPGVDYPDEVAEATGITREMCEKRGLYEDAALDMLDIMAGEADVIIAHNGTAYDKPILDRVSKEDHNLIMTANTPWFDTMLDLPIKGVYSRGLLTMCATAGFINPWPHRAIFDVMATLKLLDHYCGRMPEYVKQMAESPWVKLVAQTSFAEREAPKAMGFRWNPQLKEWWMMVREINYQSMEFPFDVAEVEV